MNNPSVSVVTPVYGCAGCLEDLADRVSMVLTGRCDSFEIIMVDDASPDGAWRRINEIAAVQPAVRGLRLSRNFGQHAAISAGLHHARGDKIVVMDCDLQDLPEEIPALLDALQGDVAVALAKRVERRDSVFKRLGSWAFYRLLEWLTDSSHDHAIANFGAYRRDVIDAINAMPETDRFFPLLVRWTGFTAKSVQVNHGRRHDGRSGYSLRQLISLATNVALSFSDKPLRLVIRIGLVFALFALCIVAYSVYAYAVGDIQVAGFTSIIASIWLVGSSILSSVGVLGLYLGRLFNGAKGRPNFIIAEQIGGVF
ncbi:MAG: glycosyltransferase family 2 protein [Devosia sp.]